MLVAVLQHGFLYSVRPPWILAFSAGVITSCETKLHAHATQNTSCVHAKRIRAREKKAAISTLGGRNTFNIYDDVARDGKIQLVREKGQSRTVDEVGLQSTIIT
eukprot:2020630-Pleurochrysis_carterae.AAC.1